MEVQSHNSKSLLFSFVFLNMIACGGGSGDDNSEQAIVEQITLPVVSAGDFTTLKATIVLQGIPDILLTQDPSESDSASISVSFDTNEDGEISAGDLLLRTGVSSAVGTGEQSLTTGLYEYVGSRFDGIALLADIEYEIDGTEVTFIVNKEQSEKLNSISTQTQVYVGATLLEGTTEDDWSADYIPEFATYTQIQNVSWISDSVSDYSGNNSIIDIHQFKLALTKD